MQTAKLFNNGRSQAVRLPKEFRLEGREVYIKRFENILVLVPKNNPWASLIKSLDQFSDDYLEFRNQPKQPSRESIR